jgi:uncharacterized membrane protein YhaH (DUF805 family)
MKIESEPQQTPQKSDERRQNIRNTILVSILVFALLFLLVGTNAELSMRINGSLFITLCIFVPSLYMSIRGTMPDANSSSSVLHILLQKGFWLTLLAVIAFGYASLYFERERS